MKKEYMCQARFAMIFTLLALVGCGSGGGGGGSSSAPQPTNQSLSALPEETQVSQAEDQMIEGNLISNGSDNLEYAIFRSPTNGSVVINGSRFEYTPNEDFHGEDSFQYRVSEGSSSVIHTVRLTVNSVNDLPVLAETQFVFVRSAPSIQFSLDIVDADGDSIVVSLVNPINVGQLDIDELGNVTYIPDAGFEGLITFDVSITDGVAEPVIATITLEITRALQIDAGQIELTVEQNQSRSELLVLSNLGSNPLPYSLVFEETLTSEAEPEITGVRQQVSLVDAGNEFLALKKGEADPRIGNPVIAGEGGPDEFGYRWVDSNEVGGPTFSWRDISQTGTEVEGLFDDSISQPIEIGFSFSFYGADYDQVYISSNGFISFTAPPSSGCCSGQPIPGSDSFINQIAWMWADLHPQLGHVYVETVDDSRFIIQFQEYGEFAGQGTVNAQVILYRNGNIDLQYESFTNGMEGKNVSIGVEGNLPNHGMQVAFNTPYLEEQLALRFSQAAFAEWLEIESVSATIPAGGDLPVALTFFGAPSPGQFEGNIQVIDENNPEEEQSIALALTVTPDVTPALPIDDLRIARNAFDEIIIEWTARADQGFVGQDLAAYDIRSSLTPITEENWAAATPIGGGLTPLNSGSLESLRYADVEALTTVYFGVVTEG